MVGRGASSLGRAGVFAAGGDPCVEVVAAVKDAAAEAEAAGAGAEVAPVAEGGDGGAQQYGGFGDGEQGGAGACNGVGHGCLLNGSGVVGRYAYRRRGFRPFGDTPPPTSFSRSPVLLQQRRACGLLNPSARRTS